MSPSAGIIQAVVPVFLLIGLGFALRRLDFVSETVVDGLSRLVFYVAVPCLLFDSIAGSELAQTFDAAAVFWAWALVSGLALILFFFSRGLPPDLRGSFVQGVFRSNLAFVGLSICEGYYGKESLAPAAVFIGLMVPLFNFWAVLVLLLPHHAGNSRASLAALGRNLILNPFILGSGAGIAAAAFHLDLPPALDKAVEWVGQIALPLALLTLGASLHYHRLRAHSGLIALASGLKLIVYPLIYLIGLLLLHRSGLLLQVPVILLATPTAVVSYITAREMKGSEELASGIVMATTLASAVTLPVWLWALQYF